MIWPVCVAGALLLFVATCPALAAPTVGTSHPGNLFTAGEPIAIDFQQASGDVLWEAQDWKGNPVASGSVPAANASGTIRLPQLPPGYYEVHCKDSTGEAVAPVGVVMDRGDQPLDKDGRIGVDAALAWCVEQGLHAKAAKMVRQAGIAWVRERLCWAAVEREPGKISWDNYDTVATLWHTEGVSVSQVVDFGPHWANAGSPNPPPRDLAAVYKFFRVASQHFVGRIQAWEAWNEVDNGWPTTADAYAAVFKAAALGVRDGDPGALILPASLSAHGKLPFQDNLAECGLADYFDVINMHRYHNPYGQEPTVRELVRMFGPKPIWLTETNQLHWLNDGRGDGQVLFRAEQQRGALYIPRVAALALAAPIQRMFIFMLPHRIEGSVQFGLLRPDLTPYPQFVALSAAANILGRATYEGRISLPNGADARLFHTPTTKVVVAWSPAPQVIPVRGSNVRVLDLFGADRTPQFASSAAGISISGEPVYIVGADLAPLQPLVDPPVTNAVVDRGAGNRVIVAPRCSLPIAKRQNWYVVDAGNPIDYQVEVWNLDGSSKAEATIALRLPKGWNADRSTANITVPPMANASVSFKLTPAAAVLGPEVLRVEGRCAGHDLAPMTSWFGRAPSAVKPCRLEDVVGQSGPDWELVSPPAGQSIVSCERLQPGVLHIRALPSAPDQRSVTLKLALGQDVRLDQFDGLLVTVEPASVRPSLRMTLTDAQSAVWECGPAGDGDTPGSQLFLFRGMDWQWQSAPAFMPALNGASAVQFSCQFAKPADAFTFRVQAVKYP